MRKRLKRWLKKPRETWSWLVVHPERVMVVVLGVGAAAGLALILADRLFLYGADLSDYSNRLYLLSSIAQSLAAILALVVSLTLVATQLAAQAYSPRVVNLRLRDPWLWGGIALYLVAILWALVFHGRLDALGPKSASVALFLAGAALLYLVPFTIATLRSLDPTNIAKTFATRGMDDALDDMLRKAVNEALVSIFVEGLNVLDGQVKRDLDAAGERPGAREEAARAAGQRFRSIGRHACQRRSTDALKAVQDSLGEVIKFCSERQWRDAANILNGVAADLEDYAQYCFGEGDAKD